MRFVEVEIIHRQHIALPCLTQEIGQCLHAEAVLIGDEPPRLPQRELGKDVGNLRVRKAELIDVFLVFADKDVVKNAFQLCFWTVEDKMRVAERIFEPVGGEAGRIVVGDGIAVVVVHIVERQAAFIEQRHEFQRRGDHHACAAFGRFLPHVVTVQKVDHVGERGRRNVMQ